MVAILANAILPSVSHAWFGQRAAELPQQEICTAFGPRLLLQTAPAPDASDAAKHGGGSMAMGQSCPFCLAQGTPFLPVMDVVFNVLPTSRAVHIPELYLAAPTPLFIWSATLSRGPPQLS